jgi:hypothetical protein
MAEYGSPELQTLTLEAAADLSLFQYCAVRISAANKCNVASDIGATSYIGVLQNKPRSGEFATVAVAGKSKMVAGGALATVAVPITYNSSGRAAAVASGGVTIGTLLEAAAADGNVITVLLQPAFRQAGAI